MLIIPHGLEMNGYAVKSPACKWLESSNQCDYHKWLECGTKWTAQIDDWLVHVSQARWLHYIAH